MGKIIRWWKYWSIWRVLLILLGSVGIGFISAYFFPHLWGLIGVIIICIICGILMWKYGADAIIDFFRE